MSFFGIIKAQSINVVREEMDLVLLLTPPVGTMRLRSLQNALHDFSHESLSLFYPTIQAESRATPKCVTQKGMEW
jgi:hypothetical protein